MSNYTDISIPLSPLHKYHIFNCGNEHRKIFFKKGDYSRFLSKYKEYMLGFVDTFGYCLLEDHFHICFGLKSAEQIIKQAEEVDFGQVNSLFYRRYVLPWFFDMQSFEKNGFNEFGLTILPIWKEIDIYKLIPDIQFYSVGKLAELLNQVQHPVCENTIENITQHHTKLDQLTPLGQLASYIVSERLRRFLLSYSKIINLENKRSGSLFQKAFRRKWLPSQNEWKKVLTYIHHNPIHHNYAIDYDAYEHSSYSTLFGDLKTALERTEVLTWYGGKSEMVEYHDKFKNQVWKIEPFFIENTNE